MKKFVIGFAVTFFINIISVASATQFSDVVDFSSGGTYLDRSYSRMSDSNSIDYFGVYNHSVDFPPITFSVDSVTLKIDYAFINEKKGNDSLKEIYFVNDSLGESIGELTWYDDDLWHSELFDLSSYVLGDLGTNWSIGFKFNETTHSTDTFYLDKSTLWGDYTATTNGVVGESIPTVVPEPSTFLLLAGGLSFLVFIVRRRKKDNFYML